MTNNMPQNDELYHYGVKGMKWGVRRFRNRDGSLTSAGKKKYSHTDKKFHKEQIIVKTKNGTTLSITENKTPKMAALIAMHSKKVRDNLENSKNCTIKDKAGNNVGEIQVYKESKDSLNVVWVQIDESYRGNGYATAVMRGVTKFAKDNNLSKITLEVPGISPDARHVYEKEGFVASEKISSDDDIWGGLTKMTKTIK